MPTRQAQSPCDEENAAALARLIADGYLNAILLSQDVFLKMMLTRYGGFGYGYILKHFVPRLKRHGVDVEQHRAHPRRESAPRLLRHPSRRCLKSGGKSA